MKKGFFVLLFSLGLFVVGFSANSLVLTVKGMSGSCCETGFKAKAEKLEGVLRVYDVSATNNVATIEYDVARTNEKEIIEQLNKKTTYTVSKATTATVNSVLKSGSCCSKPGTSKCTNTKSKSCEKK